MNRIIIFLLFLSGLVHAQTTLNELIVIGLQETYQSKNVSLRTEILDAEMASFRSSIGWQFGLDGQVPAYAKSNLSTVQNDGNIAFQSVNYNNSSIGARLSKTIWQTGGDLQVTSGLQRFDNFNTKKHVYNGIPLRVSFRQNLFGYNPYKWEVKNLLVKKEINHRQSKIDRMVIRRNITDAFFNVVFAQNDIQSSKSDVELTQELMNIAKVQDSLGVISRKQLLQLALQLKMAESKFNIANSQLVSAKNRLQIILGNRSTLDGEFEVPVPLEVDLDVDEIIRLAKANRPEWLEYRRRIQEQTEQVKSVARKYGPYIGLDASIGVIRSDVDLSPVYTDAQQDYGVRLSFNIPIFDSHLKRNKVLLEKLKLEEQKNKSQQAILELENEIERLAMEFEACQKRLDFAKEIKEIATQNLKITSKTFKQGLISIAELNLAIQDKNQALRNYLAETKRFWLFYFELNI